MEFNPSDENKPVDPEGGEGEDPEGGEGGEGNDPIVPEVPVFVPEATDLGVVGSFEASGWANDAVLNTTPTEGLLVAEGVEFAAYNEFKIRTVGSWKEGDVNIGAGAVNYFKANKYFTVYAGGGNIIVEAAGTYDIYYNVNTKVVYLMTAGTDIAEATEQTTNGQEPPYEEPEVSENVLYLAPGVWSAADAWFAAYFFIDGGATSWVKMTDENADGVFEVNIPVGFTEGANVIFCRMDPAKTAVDWGSKWNQTADLTIGENNLYTISDWGGEKSPGAWSTK